MNAKQHLRDAVIAAVVEFEDVSGEQIHGMIFSSEHIHAVDPRTKGLNGFEDRRLEIVLREKAD